jgi:hypothetical protein
VSTHDVPRYISVLKKMNLPQITDVSANETALGSDAFLSNASQGAVVANSLVENLESREPKCSIAPRDVRPGGAICRCYSPAFRHGYDIYDVGCRGV